MKALYFVGEKMLELMEVPAPVPQESEYLVRIEACGICRSDFEGYLGKTGRRIPAMVMGHESSGVIQVTPAGGKYPPGTRVAIFPNFYCGKCEFCRQGKTNICENSVFLGMLNFNGCMAEYITVKEEFLVPFGESLPFEKAAMAEPLAVAWGAVMKISDREMREAENTIVLGCGTTGLLITLLLNYRGAGKVIVVDIFDFRLELAKKLGADEVINPTKENFIEAVKRLTGGRMCELAFETHGSSKSAEASIVALRKAGKAVWVGSARQPAQIDMQKIVTNENTILGTYNFTLDEFKKCLSFLEDGVIDVAPFITDRYPLARGADAFRALQNNTGGRILKTMLITDPQS